MLNFFVNPASKICLKYAYLRTFKSANFMIWTHAWNRELAEGIKMRKLRTTIRAIN